MDRLEIVFAILITSVIQSMTFPVQTVTHGDHEINEIGSSSPLDYESQSYTPRTLPASPDQIEKMKSILGALMKPGKPASTDKDMKKLNSLIKKLNALKSGQKNQKAKRRSASKKRVPSKSDDDVESAAKTDQVDEVPEEESKSPPEEENLAPPEAGKETPPNEGPTEPPEGENPVAPKEDESPANEGNLESETEGKLAPPEEGKPTPLEDEKPAPPEEKQAPPKKEKEKADSKGPEEISKALTPLKEISKRFPQPQNQRTDLIKPKKVHFKLPERKTNTAESMPDFFPWSF